MIISTSPLKGRLPAIRAVYDEIRKEEKRTQVRERRCRALLENIQLAEEAENLYYKQPMIHKMDTYQTSDEDAVTKDESDDGKLMKNDHISYQQCEQHCESDHTEYDEEQFQIYFNPPEDKAERMKEEKFHLLLEQWREESMKNKSKRKKKKHRRNNTKNTHRSPSAFGMDDRREKSFSVAGSRSKSEMGMRDKWDYFSHSSCSSDEDDSFQKAVPMETVIDNGILRPYTKRTIDVGKLMESILQTSSEKIRKKEHPTKPDRSKDRSSSPNIFLTSVPLGPKENRAASSSPLPPSCLYVKSPSPGPSPHREVGSPSKLLPMRSPSPSKLTKVFRESVQSTPVPHHNMADSSTKSSISKVLSVLKELP